MNPRLDFEEVFLIWWLNDNENLGYMDGSINFLKKLFKYAFKFESINFKHLKDFEN
jgi:hypothetical protein